MTASILDAIFAQAKAAITRAYLSAGLLPALVLVVGWQLYEARSIKGLLATIKPFLEKTATELSATALFYAAVAIAVGVVFYAARGIVLTALRDLPGPWLRWLRNRWVARQTAIWLERRRQNISAEYHLTVTEYMSKEELALEGPAGFCAPDDVPNVTRLAETGLVAFESITSGRQQLNQEVQEAILAGLTAYYSLPLANRQQQQQQWARILQSSSAREMLERLHTSTQRLALELRNQIQQQPLQEWWLAPTRLGNVVAALEDYATRRYKIATSTLFTRLWGTLGAAERNEIATAQLILESFGNMTIAFAMLAMTVASASFYRSVPLVASNRGISVDWWTIGFVVACATLSYASYSACVSSFQAVAENITRLIDLHRVRVLAAFGFAAPQTFEEEQAIFRDLGKFFSLGTDEDLKKRKLDARQRVPPVQGPG